MSGPQELWQSRPKVARLRHLGVDEGQGGQKEGSLGFGVWGLGFIGFRV